MTTRLLVAVMCLAGALSASSASELTVDLVTRIDDETVQGRVTGVDSHGVVTVAVGGSGARTVTIPAAEVLSIRFARVSPTASRGDLVVLSSGERYRVSVSAAGEGAGIRCTSGGALHGENLVRFAHARAYVPAGSEADTVVREIETLTNDRDVVLTVKGDRLTGVVESLGPVGVEVTAKPGRVHVTREMLRGVAFSKTLERYVEPGRLLAEVYLSDGSAVLGDVTGPKDGMYDLRSVLGAVWRAPKALVREVRFRGGKLTWLSDLEPIRAEVTPFFNRTWPWRRNRSVWGNVLTVGGVVYERGVAMHSRTELTYDLGGGYVGFITMVGIDDETKGTGSALIAVTGDGRPLLEPSEITGGGKPRHVKLNVTGVRLLKLSVDFGKDQDTGDHVDWVDARLVRK